MYLDVVFNPNKMIRDSIYDKFDNYDINSEEDMMDVVDEFTSLRNDDFDYYKLFLSVLYQDYVVINNFENKKFKQFDSIDDLDEYVNYNNPTIIIDFLISSFKFGNLTPINKAKALKKSSYFGKQITNISKFYLIDYIDISRDIVKEDILCLYYKVLEDSEYGIDTEIEALDEVIDQVYSLFSYDKGNYFKLMNDIVDDAYCYYKSESNFRNLQRYEYGFLSIYETKRVNHVLSNPSEYEDVLWDVFTGFIEYNKKPEEEKVKMRKLVKGDNRSDN